MYKIIIHKLEVAGTFAIEMRFAIDIAAGSPTLN